MPKYTFFEFIIDQFLREVHVIALVTDCIASSLGLVRIITLRSDALLTGIRRIGIVSHTAEINPRPACREVMETLRLEKML